MEQNQLKELPSVSEVLLNCNKYKSLNNKYLTYIIKSEIDHYRVVAKKGKLTLKPVSYTHLTLPTNREV